jgi:hypothetical protein
MFEKLFSSPAVLQRHRAGPLAAECEAFIEMLEAKGMAHGTLLRVARYCRCLSGEIDSWPATRFVHGWAMYRWRQPTDTQKWTWN